MARETKVGLIVGLGLILFVGMMVSEYFVDSPDKQELNATDYANFNDNTTNQTQLVPTRGGEFAQAEEADPATLAAIASDRLALRDRAVLDRAANGNPITEPPFRVMTGDGLTPLAEDVTPIAIRPYNPPTTPIGIVPREDPDLALGHQLSTDRLGPGVNELEHIIHVDIPQEPAISSQPRQMIHTVASGETLSEIARKHYDGDSNMWRSIRDANPGKVGPNGEVLEGAKLVIPKRSAQAPDPTAELSERAAGENQRPAKRRVRMITVKEGQTLSEIAYEHLGSSNKWRQIMEVNSDLLEKPELLRAGMKLRIPADEEEQIAEEANAALTGEGQREPEPQPGSGARTYTVKAGDSLSLIAAKELGSMERYNEIFEANRDKLKTADDITAGMKLRMPAR